MIDIHLKLNSKETAALDDLMFLFGVNDPKEAIRRIILKYNKLNKSNNALIAELTQFKRESERVDEIVSLVKRLSQLLKEDGS